MTKSRKVAAKRSYVGHRTAHNKAMMNPIAQKLANTLRKGWSSMGLLKRGNLLNELTNLGCSTRGLERDLGQSATSIRRHIILTKLPEADRRAIDAGASAKRILMKKANDEYQRRWQERIIEDRRTGALSDDVTQVILEFCRAKERPLRIPVYGEGAEQMLNETLRCLCDFETTAHRAVRVSRRTSTKGLFKKTYKKIGNDEFWLAHQANWLANAVWAIAPERPIWESAMKKAGRRIGELKPKKTISEIYQDRARHVQRVSATPDPRPPFKGAGVWSVRAGLHGR